MTKEVYKYNHSKKEIRQQPTMEKPKRSDFILSARTPGEKRDGLDIYNGEKFAYDRHLSSLKSYPATGFDASWERRELTEGKDFEIKKQAKYTDGFNNCSDNVYDHRAKSQRRIVAIPIKGEDTKPVDKKDDPDYALYYWIARCKAAEDFIEKSPCDPDITSEQIEAYKKWQHLKN